MKRLFCLFSLLLLINLANCFAQNTDFKYYSSIQDGDYNNNFKGVALAIFLGSSSNINDETIEKFKNKFPDNIQNISKLTKNNFWLCRKALNEWDYENGEHYLVMCADNEYSTELIVLLVTITGKDEFKWWGKVITEKDFALFENMSDEAE